MERNIIPCSVSRMTIVHLTKGTFCCFLRRCLFLDQNHHNFRPGRDFIQRASVISVCWTGRTSTCRPETCNDAAAHDKASGCALGDTLWATVRRMVAVSPSGWERKRSDQQQISRGSMEVKLTPWRAIARQTGPLLSAANIVHLCTAHRCEHDGQQAAAAAAAAAAAGTILGCWQTQ
jgi:hypothetical protein